jgi:hypothetical protein
MTSQTFQLSVTKGPNVGKTFELAKPKVTIGRDDDRDIVFNVAEVSRSHAEITRQQDEYYVRDLDSTNGTFVNKEKISAPHKLEAGDLIMLGDAIYLEFEAPYDPGATMVSKPDFQDQEATAIGVSPVERKQPQQQQRPKPSPPPQQPPAGPQKQYAGQVPPSSPPLIEEEEEGKKTWLWAGIGCVVLAIFIFVVGLIAFDFLNLWCTPPFDQLLSFLYTCP